MEALQKISFILLSQESAVAKQILYQLINSRLKKQDQLNISIIPFLSSVCDGWLTLFNLFNIDINFPDIENVSFPKLVKLTRVSYKLYSDKKHNKINNMLQKEGQERLALLKKDYNFLQRNFIKIFGQKDLGVFTVNGFPYGNTSQLSIYLENILALKPITSISDYDKNASLFLTNYSEVLASFFNSVVNQDFSNSIDEKKGLSLDSIILDHNDYFFYDNKRKNLLDSNLPVGTQLFLFNILCQNNFINIIMPNVFQASGSLFFRSKLQSYLISINSLALILKKYPSFINQTQVYAIQQLIVEKEKYFTFQNNLRNNIFHYDIREIPYSVFKDTNHYFEEMIEYSVGIDFGNFITKIEKSCLTINQLLNDLIKCKL